MVSNNYEDRKFPYPISNKREVCAYSLVIYYHRSLFVPLILVLAPAPARVFEERGGGSVYMLLKPPTYSMRSTMAALTPSLARNIP
jgi:hypothetical protein